MVMQDLDSRIIALNEQYEQYEKMKTEIDTYEKFLTGIERIEEFYDDTYKGTDEICIRMREYCLNYALFIIESEGNKDDKYDDFEELNDTVYDDGGEKIYDGIYDGILDDIYDVYYDKILDEAYETADYEEWYDVRSDEYERWFDMRSAIWDADFEKTEKIMLDFQEDISKLKEKQ